MDRVWIEWIECEYRIFFFFFYSRNTWQANKPTLACTASVRELRTRSRYAADWTTAPGVSGATLPWKKFPPVSLRRSFIFSSDSSFWSWWREKCFSFFFFFKSFGEGKIVLDLCFHAVCSPIYGSHVHPGHEVELVCSIYPAIKEYILCLC